MCYDLKEKKYFNGDCPEGERAKDRYRKVKPIEDFSLDRLNGTYFCYRRAELNYHDIVFNRGPQSNDPPSTQYCGSFVDPNKRYRAFKNNTMCYPNDFEFLTKQPSQTQAQLFQMRYQKLNQHWYFKMIFDSDLNNPIVMFYLSLSPPCVFTNIPQMQRQQRVISPVYRNVDGRCEQFYTKYHSQYYETGFWEPEGNAYMSNKELYN